MNNHIKRIDRAYIDWLNTIKLQIRSTRIRMIKTANTELIHFYWRLGQMISLKLKEFPDMQGFSRQNLYYSKNFYEFYAEQIHISPNNSIVPQVEGQLQVAENYKVIFDIPWGHQKVIISKAQNIEEALFYAHQTLSNSWSRSVLENQFKQQFYEHYGQGQTNFSQTLPALTADMAQEVVKDPYWFDFVSVSQKARERDIEKQLVEHVTRYLLEMGNGFAFVAKQKHFQVGDSDFYADLILYSIKLHAYIVVELKATPFKPEYAGQLNFYINIVDDQLRGENDNKTIGLLLCKGKDEVVAQYALTGYAQPIGVSDYQLSKAIPENLKSALPSIEEVEEELSQLLDNKKDEK